MIVTGRHLPRRTFLKGLGAAIALPALDAMTPAFAGAGARTVSPMRLAFTYVPNGVTLTDWTPAERGPRVHVLAHPRAARALPRRHARAHRPRAQERERARRRPRRSRARGGRVPHRRARPQDGRRRHPERHLGRSDCRRAHRQRHALPLHRARVRRLAHGRQLRLRLQLRLHQQRLVAQPDLADAARRPTRGWRSSGCSARSTPGSTPTPAPGGCSTAAASSTPCRSAPARSSAISDRPTGARWTSTCRRSARSSAASSSPSRTCASSRRASRCRAACRCSFADYVKLMFDLQVVAFQADLTRVVDDDDGPRGEHPHLSRDRRAGSASSAHPPRRASRTGSRG